MLVLTRKLDETIVIGDPANPIATISVKALDGYRVRLGIEADRKLRVYRGELATRVIAETPKPKNRTEAALAGSGAD
jgi:carbon storage regulator CsrA